MAVVTAGAIREVLIARTFGISNDLDFFLIASAVPLALVSLFGGSWQSAATPELTGGVLGLPGRPYLRIVRLIAWPLALVAAGAALIASRQLAPLLDRAVLYNTMLIAAVWLGLLAAGRFPLALASGRPSLVVAAPAAVHLSIAAAVLVLGARPYALFGGLLVGNLLLYVAVRRYAYPIGDSSAITLSRESVRQVFHNLKPIAAGAAAMALALPVDLFFAARAEVGGPSVINYATRVPLAVSVVGGTVISTVVFADLVANRSIFENLRRRLRAWLRRAAAFASISAVFVWIFSPTIVNLLFASERFAQSELQSVIEVQRIAALSIPPFVWGLVLVRCMNAIEFNRPLFWISVVNLLVNLAGNWALTPILGLSGILLSTAIMYSCSSLLLWLTWRRSASQK